MLFHHLGWACQSIESEARVLQLLGYTKEGSRFVDPVQGIEGEFWNGGGPRIELLQQLPGSQTLQTYVQRSIRVYHHAFETTALEKDIEHFRKEGAKVLREPMPAIGFGGRRITFLALPNLYLIELIEIT